MGKLSVFPIKSAEKKGSTQRFFIVLNLYFLNGGADGIRTHAPVTRSTSLAGKPLEPLEYYSTTKRLYIIAYKKALVKYFLPLVYSNYLFFNFL